MTTSLFFLPGRLVAALALMLVLAVPVARAEGGEAFLRPEHVAPLAEAEAALRDLLIPHLQAGNADAATMMTLLDAPRIAVPPRLDLAGAWRVRSLQVNDLGVYIYRYFSCALVREGADGLRLDKNKGSQRRLGLVMDSEGSDAYLVLGGSYYSDEAPRPYSAFVGEAGADTSRDAVGLLHALGPDHLIIIFAALDGGPEIYEMVRP